MGMKLRDFLKSVPVVGAALCALSAPKWSGPGPAYAAVGDLPPGWEWARVIDLDTGRELRYGGRPAEVVECSAEHGWAIVQDHYTPKGSKYLQDHDELLKIRLNGSYELQKSGYRK